MPEKLGRFAIKFETERNAVDVKAYGIVLSNTVVVFEEYANSLETGARLVIRVEAERPGSFLPEFSIEAAAPIVGTLTQLLTPENILVAKEFVSKVVEGVGKCLDFFKKTKDNPPTKVVNLTDGSIQVTGNNYGTIIVEKNVFETSSDPRTQEAIVAIFDGLRRDPTIDEVRLLNESNKSVFEVKRSDFAALSVRPKQIEARTRKRVIGKAVLSITRLSFDENKTFNFIYAGNEITASVTDATFWNALKRREPFARGDKLVVKLEITERWNESAKAFERVGYKVLEVLEHRTPERQTNLLSGLSYLGGADSTLPRIGSTKIKEKENLALPPKRRRTD